MSSTSGCARSSHSSTRSMRALSELTFQVAMRISDRLWGETGLCAGRGKKIALAARHGRNVAGMPRELDAQPCVDSVPGRERHGAHFLEALLGAAQPSVRIVHQRPDLPAQVDVFELGPDPCKVDRLGTSARQVVTDQVPA